jgi:hypothetical protein
VAVCPSACGKKGDPLPPLRPTPAAISGLRLAQRGDRVEISFTAPRASTDGARLPVLEIELFVAQGEGDFLKLARMRSFNAAPGEALTQSEPLPAPGTSLRVGARAVAKGHRGSLGEPARLLVVAPLPVPRNLSARLVGEGVALAWDGEVPAPLPPPTTTLPAPGASFTQTKATSPQTSPPTPDSRKSPPSSGTPPPAPLATPPPRAMPTAPSPPQAEAAPPPMPAPTPTPPPFTPGFFAYRRAPTGRYGLPLDNAVVVERATTDRAVQPGESWCYEVRAVAAPEPRVESAPSNEVCLEVEDVVPPAPPTGVTAILREDGIEVSWSPSPEPDLLLYRVYRSERGAERERVAEVAAPETVFLDTEAPPERAVRYTLTAVDKAGHESAGASTPAVRRP